MIYFSCLMWIDEANHSSINNKSKKLESYFRQLSCLSRSIEVNARARIYVFTNDPERIESWFRTRRLSAPNFVRIDSSPLVPSGTKFFGAHHKIVAYQKAESLLKDASDRLVFLDIDVLMLRPIADWQIDLIMSADIIAYDIANQVGPAYGHDRILKDIRDISGVRLSELVWYGGEFLIVSPKGLSALIHAVGSILPDYLQRISCVHHVGDEMYLTAGLCLIKDSRRDLLFRSDSESIQLVSRHWSRFSLPSLDYHFERIFLHCPGSKPLLELLSLLPPLPTWLLRFCFGFYSSIVISFQWSKKNVRGMK